MFDRAKEMAAQEIYVSMANTDNLSIACFYCSAFCEIRNSPQSCHPLRNIYGAEDQRADVVLCVDFFVCLV